MEPAERRRYTEEEYLALEARSETKHELVNGELYAMAGASIEHNLIAGNIAGALRNALQAAGRPCLVLGSDQRLHVAETGLYTYPDVSVVCGKPELHGPAPRALLNPLVLIEVLSESTESDDRGPKFAHYRSIPSLKEVLFVAQIGRRVEHYRRLETGQWLLTERTDGAVEIPALGCALPLAEIYAGLELLG